MPGEEKKCKAAYPGPAESLKSWNTLVLVFQLQDFSISVWPKSQSRLKKYPSESFAETRHFNVVLFAKRR